MTETGSIGKRFALIGAAGYIAPRHLAAIRDTRGQLVAAHDVTDNVGIMDRFFPDAHFFTHFESFGEFLRGLSWAGEGVDYVSICSPNFLHRPHISFALAAEADAICEKPLVLSPSDLDLLEKAESESGRRVNTILQLRLHQSIIALRDSIRATTRKEKYEVDLAYFVTRGRWYSASWKGDTAKSGGLATNIGVHFFDMLVFLFGPKTDLRVHHRSDDLVAGYLELENARVRWVLSINRNYLPKRTPAGQTTFRSISLDGKEFEFSEGFTDLHTESYRAILRGEGFGIAQARPATEIVHAVRTASISGGRTEWHPDLAAIIAR